MRYIIAAFLLMGAFVAQGQSVVPLRGDTIKIYKAGGFAELVLQNRTKDSLGVMINTGNGKTEFRRAKKLDATHIIIGLDTIEVGSGTGADSSIFATLYRLDTAKINLRAADALKKDKSDSTGPTSYVPRNQVDTMRDNLYAGIAGKLSTVNTTNSITGNGTSGTPVKLVNDAATPGNSKYYGTDAGGTKGYFALPIIGSSQTFPQVLATGRTLSADDSILLNGKRLYFKGGRVRADSAHVNVAATLIDTAYFLGDSRTINIFANFNNRYTDIISQSLSLIQKNLAVSGMNISSPTGNSLLANMNLIPTKTSKSKYLFWWFMTNDVLSFTASQFSTGYRKAIDTAIARGWSASDMYILCGWQPGSSNLANQTIFHDTLSSICTGYGITFADFMLQQKAIDDRAGGTIGMTYDGVHDNLEGNNWIAYKVLPFVKNYNLRDSNQVAAVNGELDLSKVRIRTQDTTKAQLMPRLLGLDNNGKALIIPAQSIIRDVAQDSSAQAANIKIQGGGTARWLAGTGIASGLPVSNPGMYITLFSTANGGYLFSGNGQGTIYKTTIESSGHVIFGSFGSRNATTELVTIAGSGLNTNYIKCISPITTWNDNGADLSFDSASNRRFGRLQSRSSSAGFYYTTTASALGGGFVVGDTIPSVTTKGGFQINKFAYINKDSVPHNTSLPGAGEVLMVDTGTHQIKRVAPSLFGSSNASAAMFKPTMTNVLNCTGMSIDSFFYQKINNIVTVTAYAVVDCTSDNTSTQFTMTLPFASTLGGNDVFGTGIVQGPGGEVIPGVVMRNGGDFTKPLFAFKTGTGNGPSNDNFIRFSFTYKIN